MTGCVTGLVLAGGRGRRVGARDKGLIEYRGHPLAAYAVAHLRPHCARVLISANRNEDRYAKLADGVVADGMAGFAGPLAGVDAGLRMCTSSRLAICPCDVPALPRECYAALLAALARAPEAVAAVLDDGERLQPLVAVMRAAPARTALQAWLAAGGRSVFGWLERVTYVTGRCAVRGGLDNLNVLPRDA